MYEEYQWGITAAEQGMRDKISFAFNKTCSVHLLITLLPSLIGLFEEMCERSFSSSFRAPALF